MNYHIRVGNLSNGGPGMTLCELTGCMAGEDLRHFSCDYPSFAAASVAAMEICETGREARVVRGDCPNGPSAPKPKRKKWGTAGSKVSRKVPSTVFSAGKRNRDVVISVYPDGVIGLRLAGQRSTSEVSIEAGSVYKIAAAIRARADRAKRKAAKKAGKV
jgi:hypothetical protein